MHKVLGLIPSITVEKCPVLLGCVPNLLTPINVKMKLWIYSVR